MLRPAVDVGFLLLLGGGIAFLTSGALVSSRTRARRAGRLGMRPRPDLSHLSVDLQRSALWAISDGGNERAVVGGTASLRRHDIPVTVFDLEPLRIVRGEWAYLAVDRPFRAAAHTTVVACSMPREFPQLLLKRAGAADIVEARPADLASMSASIREVFGIQRGLAADRPPRLPAATCEGVVAAPWRVWAEDPPTARRMIDDAVASRMASLPRGFEPVIEVVGNLVLVWSASPAPLPEATVRAAIDVAEAFCERALEISPELTPRGVA